MGTMKLVSERSERDIAVVELGNELAELAAQMMRLAAGGGSIMRWGDALNRAMKLFDRSFDGQPLSIGQIEMQEALKFQRPWVAASDIEQQIEQRTKRQIDTIATQALRLVASRLEGNSMQERLSEGRLLDAVHLFVEARAERYKERQRGQPIVIRHTAPRRLKKTTQPTSAPLSARMVDALKFLGETDRTALRGMRRPGAATLRALEVRGLIKPGGATLGYSLTARGLEAREGC